MSSQPTTMTPTDKQEILAQMDKLREKVTRIWIEVDNLDTAIYGIENEIEQQIEDEEAAVTSDYTYAEVEQMAEFIRGSTRPR